MGTKRSTAHSMNFAKAALWAAPAKRSDDGAWDGFVEQDGVVDDARLRKAVSRPLRDLPPQSKALRNRARTSRIAVVLGQLALLISVLLCQPLSRADAPTLEALFPSGGERGSTNAATAFGKFEPWPPKVWVLPPDVVFTAETNKGKFSVSIPKEASPGPRLVRLYNADGASEVRFFIVSDARETSEIEPNNHFAKASPAGALPVTVNGRLDKRDDVDSFAIELSAGQTLDAHVDSYTLMSKVDAVLRLVTTNGQQLAWNHDFITLDPRLTWHSPAPMTVVLQVFGFSYPADSEIRLAGGDAASYRLHLAVSTNTAPPCAEPNEREPNDTEPQSIELPAAVSGTIGRVGDEDRYRFDVTEGDYVELHVEAASFGSPLDAWLKVEDADGKQLARNDDADNSADARLEWKAPKSGRFMVAVGSVTQRGGEPFRYRLSVRPVKADYRATLEASSVVLMTGATNELKLNVKRLRGFTNEFTIACGDLPADVTLLTTNVAAKTESIPLQFVTSTNAPAFHGSVRVMLIDDVTKAGRAVPFEFTSRTENNGVPGGYTRLLADSTEHLWLTIRPKPAETNAPAAK